MKTQFIFTDAGWNFSNIWGIKQGTTYPYLLKSLASFFNPMQVIYDSIYHSVTTRADVGFKEVGIATVYYNGSTTPPTNAGNYTITVDIAENTNYNGVVGLNLGTFTIEKATLTAEDFEYDLSAKIYDRTEKPIAIAGKTDNAFKTEIDSLIGRDIVVLYEHFPGDWLSTVPVNAWTYGVSIVINSGTTNFTSGSILLGQYIIGAGHNITYKNYDGSEIENLDPEMPIKYVEGLGLTLPTTPPSDDMEGWEFLGFWDCPLDKK